MEYALTPLPGGISITSVPEGAEVFINNRKRGVTPCVLTDLPAAIYEVRAEKDGFDPVTRKVEITAGYKDEIKLVLLSSTGELELDIRPAGVTVQLDGRDIGVTAANGDSAAATKPIRVSGLKPGKHTVTVSHPRSRPQSRSIEIEVEKGKLTPPRRQSMYGSSTVKSVTGTAGSKPAPCSKRTTARSSSGRSPASSTRSAGTISLRSSGSITIEERKRGLLSVPPGASGYGVDGGESALQMTAPLSILIGDESKLGLEDLNFLKQFEASFGLFNRLSCVCLRIRHTSSMNVVLWVTVLFLCLR